MFLICCLSFVSYWALNTFSLESNWDNLSKHLLLFNSNFLFCLPIHSHKKKKTKIIFFSSEVTASWTDAIRHKPSFWVHDFIVPSFTVWPAPLLLHTLLQIPSFRKKIFFYYYSDFTFLFIFFFFSHSFLLFIFTTVRTMTREITHIIIRTPVSLDRWWNSLKLVGIREVRKHTHTHIHTHAH